MHDSKEVDRGFLKEANPRREPGRLAPNEELSVEWKICEKLG
jgi:hypothetical protein